MFSPGSRRRRRERLLQCATVGCLRQSQPTSLFSAEMKTVSGNASPSAPCLLTRDHWEVRQ
jgi:hypothetical protein